LALLKRREDKVDVIADVALFAGLSKKELGEIANIVKEVEFLPRDYLAYEGETGREAMIVIAGKATVRRGGRKVAEVSTGSVVGEMSLLTDLPRNATVRADTFVSALVMNATQFSRLVDEHPQVGVKILRTVARRLAVATRIH
jgi:CRP-like cAMP-binding protein